MAKTYFGRIKLRDSSRKFSRFGVFEEFDGKELICFEALDSTEGELIMYLERTPFNEHLVNEQVSVGDIVQVSGEEKKYGDKQVFLVGGVKILGKCESGMKSDIFELSDKVIEIATAKSMVLQRIREEFGKKGFIEINSSTLLPFYEGGFSPPFITKDVKGRELYLRQTSELVLRRLVAAGLTKVYEIGKSYRNIEAGATFSNEFTVVESVFAYGSLGDGMAFAEDTFRLMLDAFKSSPHASRIVQTDWPKVRFIDEYKKIFGEEYRASTDYQKSKKDLRGILENLEGPCFLVGIPIPLSPINKIEGPVLSEAYFLIDGQIFGDIPEFEINPDSLEERLKMQVGLTGGQINRHFLKLVREGMPPGVGLGFGVDRWVGLILNKPVNEIINIGGII